MTIPVKSTLYFLSKAALLTNKNPFACYQILLCLLAKMYKYKNIYMFLYLYIKNNTIL